MSKKDQSFFKIQFFKPIPTDHKPDQKPDNGRHINSEKFFASFDPNLADVVETIPDVTIERAESKSLQPENLNNHKSLS